jgi:hypothetical protein
MTSYEEGRNSTKHRVGYGQKDTRKLAEDPIEDEEGGTDEACFSVRASSEGDDTIVLGKDTDHQFSYTGARMNVPHRSDGKQCREESSHSISEDTALNSTVEFGLRSVKILPDLTK